MLAYGKTLKRTLTAVSAAALALALAPGLAFAVDDPLQALPPSATDKLVNITPMGTPVETVVDAVSVVMDQLGISDSSGEGASDGVVSNAASQIQERLDEATGVQGGDEPAVGEPAPGATTVSTQADDSSSSSASASSSSASASTTDSSSSSASASTGTAATPDVAGPHTISWANTETDASSFFGNKDAHLQNGTAELVSVKVDSKTLKASEIPATAGADKVSYAKGVLDAPAGSTITMKLLPARGYQLNKTTICGGAITVTPIDDDDEETVGYYSFSMPQTGYALDCGFTAATDVVESSSDAVTGGSISGAQSAVTNGTLMLSVDDMDKEDDDEKKIMSQFDTKAGSASNIVAYLDLSLDNIINQGSEEDSWYTEVTSTPSAITVKLILADKIASSSSQFYIIREHEGNYQQASVTFNATEKSITFNTDKFSSYAVVKGAPGSSTPTTTPTTPSSTSNSSSASLPKTGDADRATPLAACAACSAAVAAFALRRLRRLHKQL